MLLTPPMGCQVIAIFAKDMPQMKQVKSVGICSKYAFLSLRSPWWPIREYLIAWNLIQFTTTLLAIRGLFTTLTAAWGRPGTSSILSLTQLSKVRYRFLTYFTHTLVEAFIIKKPPKSNKMREQFNILVNFCFLTDKVFQEVKQMQTNFHPLQNVEAMMPCNYPWLKGETRWNWCIWWPKVSSQ